MKHLALVILSCLLTSMVNAATFKGYQCTQNCSGHKAGYEWAMKKGITDKSRCTGKSRSFIEGCYAWVDEQSVKRKKQ